MIFLLLRILLNTCFSQLLRLAQVRDGQMLPAALVNYFVAAVVSGGGLLLFRPAAPHAVSLWLGVTTGVTYAVAMLGIETAMHTSGVSITVAVLQLSVLVPVLSSMLFFHERPDASQFVGIAAAIIALPLLSRSRAIADEDRETLSLHRTVATMVTLFFVAGGSGVAMKAFQFYAPPGDRLAYTVALFTVSTLVIGAAVAVRRMEWGPLAWPVGSLIGLSNLLQLIFTLQALAVLQAVIVFPITSSLTVALNTLLAVRFWNERLDSGARFGIALAILSAVLLNR